MTTLLIAALLLSTQADPPARKDLPLTLPQGWTSTPMSVDQFKNWLRTGDTKKPLSKLEVRRGQEVDAQGKAQPTRERLAPTEEKSR